MPVRLIAACLLIAAAVLASPARAGEQARIEVVEPWARATVIKTGAVYLTIVNRGDGADRLVGASTPTAARAELHEATMDGGVMRMREREDVKVGAHESVTFAPGGLHLMLMGLHRPLAAGETIPLTLTFEKAGAVHLEVPVKPAGAGTPHGHGGASGH